MSGMHRFRCHNRDACVRVYARGIKIDMLTCFLSIDFIAANRLFEIVLCEHAFVYTLINKTLQN